MRVWHYNEGFYMERKRDLIISWRYASLAMNRGAIKQGFTVLDCCEINFRNILFDCCEINFRNILDCCEINFRNILDCCAGLEINFYSH